MVSTAWTWRFSRACLLFPPCGSEKRGFMGEIFTEWGGGVERDGGEMWDTKKGGLFSRGRLGVRGNRNYGAKSTCRRAKISPWPDGRV